MFALRFDLDDYTTIWASPHAALLFWAAFVLVVVVVTCLTMYAFRRMRPH
jgi:hypothetical protein